MRKLTFMIPIAAIAACTKPSGDSDSGTDSNDSADTDTDTDTDTDFDPALDIVVEYSSDTIEVSLSNTDTTNWLFGMAETASGEAGWYGEACEGDELCHEGDDGLAILMDSVESIDDVVTFGSSQTTLFDDDNDGFGDAFTSTDEDRLSYIVYFVDGTNPPADSCYVWGDDPAYFSGGCEAL